MEHNQSQPPVFNQPQQPAAPQYQPHVTAQPMMDPVTAVKTCLKKYFDFKGRARRSEYWWFMLFVAIVSSVFNYGGLLVPALSFVGALCSLVFIIPQFAAMTRRLHDTGRSGWWVLLLAVLSLVMLGALVKVLTPIASQMLEVTDTLTQAQMMADAIQASPAASTIMFSCGLVAGLFGLITFIFTLLDSKWGENKYGPSPKYK
ncbi:MAG: DUF805 domain-containing protein [Muribaculaceae bacterium]|nr:DUF805 domain-containing protein [Muribaculaceae bacterium]